MDFWGLFLGKEEVFFMESSHFELEKLSPTISNLPEN
jgi:hypothetical protein